MKDPVEDREAFLYIEHLENVAEPTPDAGETPPPQPRMEPYPSAGASLLDRIPQQGGYDADSCLEDICARTPTVRSLSAKNFVLFHVA